MLSTKDPEGRGIVTKSETIDILVSYAISEEGTNTLFVKLIENLFSRHRVLDEGEE